MWYSTHIAYAKYVMDYKEVSWVVEINIIHINICILGKLVKTNLGKYGMVLSAYT